MHIMTSDEDAFRSFPTIDRIFTQLCVTEAKVIKRHVGA